MKTLLALFAAMLLTAGCETVRYELRPPPSDAGRACVTQCAGIREICRGNEIHRARDERESCERRAEHSLRSCLAAADSKERRKDCEQHKPSCWASENYDHCEGEYRSCYSQCGGMVTKIVE